MFEKLSSMEHNHYELWKKYGRTFYPFGEIPPYVVYLDNLDNIPIKKLSP